ncbi:hypothetical protein JXM67_01840 [candidate division WOR-3 bacterium]|nr:hypothetical protein [candidate division WOR-3 bacterium]
MPDKDTPDIELKDKGKVKSDALDWFIVATGAIVLVLAVLWLAGVIKSWLLVRVAVAVYCLLLGSVFILKRTSRDLISRFSKGTLLFYLIGGICALVVGAVILILVILG